jgi:hypothetical protein
LGERFVHVIDFRYHVVSIVAVFLALSLGLFIGSTSLRPQVAQDLKNRTDKVANANRTLKSEIDAANTAIGNAKAFDNALEPYALADRLAGNSVVLVSAPGADDGVRKQVTSALTLAGATIVGDVRLNDVLLDPQQDQFLTTLVDRVAIPNKALPPGTGAARALALLADVLGTRPQGQTVGSDAAAKVLSAFTAGKLIGVSGAAPRPAGLAIMLAAAGPSQTDAAAADAQARLLADFAGDLDRASSGAVVTGPLSAAAGGGLLDVIRADKSLRSIVSTVDGAELPSGVIATVLACAEQAAGNAGSYGVASGSDRPLPSPAPSPS